MSLRPGSSGGRPGSANNSGNRPSGWDLPDSLRVGGHSRPGSSSSTTVPVANQSPFESTTHLERQPTYPAPVELPASQPLRPELSTQTQSSSSTQFEPQVDLSTHDASYIRAYPGQRNEPQIGMDGWADAPVEEAPRTWEEDLERRARAGAELQRKEEQARLKEQEDRLKREFWEQEQRDWEGQAGMQQVPSSPVVGLADNNPWSEQLGTGPPPPPPPRPMEVVESSAVGAAAVEVARPQIDPATEIYQIKHVNIVSPVSQSLHRFPILLQNENGPCPLMALVNAITIASPPDTTSAVVETLKHREQISLSLLLEAVFEELMTLNTPLPDVGDLFQFLITLHTGMNVNPRFNNPPNTPGAFEQTKELTLYAAFAIPLLHGWLPDPDTPAGAALARAKSYDETQTLLFSEEELITRLTTTDVPATEHEQTLLADSSHARDFLESSATQLTPYGLRTLRALPDRTVAILFRNDHFSTIYIRNANIYSLVTDAGFATHEEIVWELLADVRGSNNSFHSGDFLPVGGPQRQQPVQSLLEPSGSGSTAPEEQNADYDLALAMSLQEEEDRRGAGAAGGGSAHGHGGEAAGARGRARSEGASAPPLPPRQEPAMVQIPAREEMPDGAPPPYEPTPVDRPAWSDTHTRVGRERVPVVAGHRRGQSVPNVAGAGVGGGADAATVTGKKSREEKCAVM